VASPPDVDEVDPLREEWAYACTAGGTRVFPYGDVYEKTGCVTLDYASDPVYLDSEIRLRPSREAKKCQGGFPGLYDMGGNASEWIDESYDETGKSDTVIMFGADYATGKGDTKCIYRESATRDERSGGTGIRCCKEGP
jgi:formylglycine-generating enzyme required for sulfatase activity